MSTTQQQLDLKTAKTAAAKAGLDCRIEAVGDDYTITMATGEVEPVTGLPGVLRVIHAYAAQLVAFNALNLAAKELRLAQQDMRHARNRLHAAETTHSEAFMRAKQLENPS